MTPLRRELLDALLADHETPEDLLGDDGLFKRLKKALLERALGAELTDHPGHEKGDPAGRCRPRTAKLVWWFRATATAPSSLRSFRRGSAGSTASTTASCRCMRAA